MPNLFILAGPNGAGKSTSAPEVLSGVRKVAEFVNADVIQKEAGVSEIEAARITLGRLEALAGAKKDMAFETTLASHMLVPRVRRMQEAGGAWLLVLQAAATIFQSPSFGDDISVVSKISSATTCRSRIHGY